MIVWFSFSLRQCRLYYLSEESHSNDSAYLRDTRNIIFTVWSTFTLTISGCRQRPRVTVICLTPREQGKPAHIFSGLSASPILLLRQFSCLCSLQAWYFKHLQDHFVLAKACNQVRPLILIVFRFTCHFSLPILLKSFSVINFCRTFTFIAAFIACRICLARVEKRMASVLSSFSLSWLLHIHAFMSSVHDCRSCVRLCTSFGGVDFWSWVSSAKRWWLTQSPCHCLPSSIMVGTHEIVFSDKVRNSGFILDSNFTMKQHVIEICQTAYYELKLTHQLHP